jgi:hypothetical protein
MTSSKTESHTRMSSSLALLPLVLLISNPQPHSLKSSKATYGIPTTLPCSPKTTRQNRNVFRFLSPATHKRTVENIVCLVTLHMNKKDRNRSYVLRYVCRRINSISIPSYKCHFKSFAAASMLFVGVFFSSSKNGLVLGILAQVLSQI